jgi:hypothetical protein
MQQEIEVPGEVGSACKASADLRVRNGTGSDTDVVDSAPPKPAPPTYYENMSGWCAAASSAFVD